MNPFDSHIIFFLNQFSQRSPFWDNLICLVNNEQLTMPIVISIFWWLWFRDDERKKEHRQIIISGLFLCTLAIFLARALATTLPFRERPLRNPALHFVMPYGADASTLLNWSSFPSDHAVFCFALATAIFLVSRRLGILVFLYTFFVICLPRIYLGFHYPTDILIGALIGIGTASLSSIASVRTFLSSRPTRLLERSPRTFYSIFYLTTFMFGTMFNPLRTVAQTVIKAGHQLVHHVA